MAQRRLHHAADGRDIGCLRSAEAGEHIHREHFGDQQTAGPMADPLLHHVDHAARHPAGFDERAGDHEEWHSKQDEAGHAVLHRRRDRGDRRLGGDHEIQQPRQRQHAGNRYAGNERDDQRRHDQQERINVDDVEIIGAAQRERCKRHGHGDGDADADRAPLQRDEFLEREQTEQQQPQAEPDRDEAGTQPDDLQGLRELSREKSWIGSQRHAADAQEDRQPTGLQCLPPRAMRLIDQRGIGHAAAAAEIRRRAEEGDDGDQDGPDV